MKTEEFFEQKSNSKCWPSDDPQDSPTTTFTCKLCGEKITMPDFALMLPSAIDRHVNSHVLRYKGEID